MLMHFVGRALARMLGPAYYIVIELRYIKGVFKCGFAE
jgi:hypothetical protein